MTDLLDSIGVQHALYDKVIPNPTDAGVSAAPAPQLRSALALGGFRLGLVCRCPAWRALWPTCPPLAAMANTVKS